MTEREDRAAYMRNWRAKRRLMADSGAPVPHGTRDGYSNWGCRCAPCREANLEGSRGYPRNRALDLKAAAAGRYWRSGPPAPNSGKVWTGAELEVLTARRDDGGYLHPLSSVAEMLGRTRGACSRMRMLCMRDPKYILLVGQGSGESTA